MFAAEDRLAAGELVFGAALDPGEAPLSEVDVGSAVRLLYAPKTPSGGAVPATPPRARLLGDGVVWAVETLGTGQLWVSMRVSDGVGLAASQAAQDDALRVVLSGSGA
jgi:hypothetical protein